MARFVRFIIDCTIYSLKGGRLYYTWLLFLLFFMPFWLFGWYQQLSKGLIVTGLNDQVTWGVYLSNFVFLVGVAAAAVTVVFPAYAYNRKELKKVAVIGEMLAISAVTMCMLFVIAHMGRPDRLWHIIPGIGIFNWPNSMLTWDVIVLNGYLALNFYCAFYYLYKKYVGEDAYQSSFFMPVVYVAMVWALSIHTVTAFLLNTMPARPLWFHSIMPIKFISTAFASGPALMIIAFMIIRRYTKLKIGDDVINFMSQVFVWCLGIALFLILSEVVTELYPATEHSYSLQYLMFGWHGLNKLTPWWWLAIILMVSTFILLLFPNIRKNHRILPYISGAAFFGIWIDKGMGLVIPGFIPSPIGEFSEYTPSWIEIFISSGNWAFGILIFTLLTKGTIGVLTGEVRYGGEVFEEEAGLSGEEA